MRPYALEYVPEGVMHVLAIGSNVVGHRAWMKGLGQHDMRRECEPWSNTLRFTPAQHHGSKVGQKKQELIGMHKGLGDVRAGCILVLVDCADAVRNHVPKHNVLTLEASSRKQFADVFGGWIGIVTGDEAAPDRTGSRAFEQKRYPSSHPTVVRVKIRNVQTLQAKRSDHFRQCMHVFAVKQLEARISHDAILSVSGGYSTTSQESQGTGGGSIVRDLQSIEAQP